MERAILGLSAAILLPALAGCGIGMEKSDPRYAEVEQAHHWMKRLRAEDPDTGVLLAHECQDEVGWWLSNEGVVAMLRCMRRKYDEGVRAEGSEELTIA